MMSESRKCQENITQTITPSPSAWMIPEMVARCLRSELTSSCSNGVKGEAIVADEHQSAYVYELGSAKEAHQRSLNSSLGDTVGSSLVLLGRQLLKGSTSIRLNASLQPSFTSVIYGQWCTSFAPSLILDSAILLRM
ncbi:hypothetical protein TNCV_2857231 [Trichonephila clavipes]|nr:hypothetical protein TNCV_2857231 [Trichonephila clavipes]